MVGGPPGLAERVAARLRGRGLAASAAPEPDPAAAGAILLHGLEDFAGPAEAAAANARAFAAARALAPRLSREGGLFVAVTDVGGDFGLSGHAGAGAWAGGLAGLAKTAALEWPRCSVKAIDLAREGRSPDEVAEALVEELVAGGPEVEVGLPARGRRLVPRAVEAAVGPGPARLGPDDVIVVSGGARGVTATAVLALAREIGPRIALVGRTPLDEAQEPPELAAARDEAAIGRVLLAGAREAGETLAPRELRSRVRRVAARREIRAFLDEVAATGASVRYYSADVRDAAAVAEVCREVRAEWGPITGFVHGAGVLADKLIVDKTEESFDAVFGTKVDGLRAFLDATAEDPLRMVCLFSSVAGRFGNVGQSDYSMANEVLTRVARSIRAGRGDGCVVKSIGWGPWDGGMVTPGLRDAFAERGIALLGSDDGARRFVEEIRLGAPDEVEVLVVGGDGPARALVAGDGAERGWIVEVDRARHPFLDDHRVEGVPVLPVVLVLEWFARLAAALDPEMEVERIEALQVLRGVPLDRFDDGGHRFALGCGEDADGALHLSLRDADGAARYSAVARRRPAGSAPAAAPPQPPAPGEPWPLAPEEAYDGPLFHGPAFRVLREMESRSADGAAALLDGTASRGWAGGPWRVDPALLDGGLQLARLWALEALGRPTLPTRVGAFVPHYPADPTGPFHCELRAEARPHHVVAHLLFRTAGGEVAAELRDVSMHATLQKAPLRGGEETR